MFAPVKRSRVYEAVAAQIEALIVSGTLKAGARLPSERELMAQLSVGRPAIREAILMLQNSGLLRISNGERAVVVQPTTESVLLSLSSAVRVVMADDEGVRNFQAARKMLEISLVRQAAASASARQIAKLQCALRANEDALGRTERFELTDVAFHYEIARIAGNPIFTGIHEALSGWLLEQRTVALGTPDADRRAYQFHRRIFEAIAAHDRDGAEDAMAAHLSEVETQFWTQRCRHRGAKGEPAVVPASRASARRRGQRVRRRDEASAP